MQCNETCCSYNYNDTICFGNYNYSDYNDYESPSVWSLTLRWTITLPLTVIGSLGNAFILLILIKNTILMRTSVNYFIFNMCFADLVLSIVGPIPFTIKETTQFYTLGVVWCHLDIFLQVMLMLVSALSLAVISYDRMQGIAYPHHHHMRTWQSIVVIGAIWALSISLATPFSLNMNYWVRMYNDVNETACDEILEETWKWWIILILTLDWIPLSVMIVCYIILFIKFKKFALKVEGKEHPGILKMKRKVVRMLFAAVVAFMICYTPFQVYHFLNHYLFSDDNFVVQEEYEQIASVMRSITQYIVYANSVVDPFIYGLMHQNFKRGFRITFPCLFVQKPDFELKKGQGKQAFVWSSRSSLRHTIHVKAYESRPDVRNVISPLRRTASLKYERHQTLFNQVLSNERNDVNVERNSEQTFDSINIPEIRVYCEDVHGIQQIQESKPNIITGKKSSQRVILFQENNTNNLNAIQEERSSEMDTSSITKETFSSATEEEKAENESSV